MLDELGQVFGASFIQGLAVTLERHFEFLGDDESELLKDRFLLSVECGTSRSMDKTEGSDRKSIGLSSI